MLKGDLTTTPLAPLLIDLANDAASGCLHIIDTADEEALVFFKGGLVYAVSVPGSRPQLGAKLVSSGALAPEALSEALEAQRTELQGWRLGELLVHLGYVDQPVVEAFIKEQVSEALWDLLRWTTGRWKFRKNIKAREDVGPPMVVVDLLEQLRERGYEWENISAVVHGPAAVPKLSTRGDTSAETTLDNDAWSMLCKIDGVRSVSDLASDCGYTLFEAGHVIVSLVQAGLVDIDEVIDAASTELYGATTLSSALAGELDDDESAVVTEIGITEHSVDDDAMSRLARMVNEVGGSIDEDATSGASIPVASNSPDEQAEVDPNLVVPLLQHSSESFAASIARVSNALSNVLGDTPDDSSSNESLTYSMSRRSTQPATTDPEWQRRKRLRTAAAEELATAHALIEAEHSTGDLSAPLLADGEIPKLVSRETDLRRIAEREAAKTAKAADETLTTDPAPNTDPTADDDAEEAEEAAQAAQAEADRFAAEQAESDRIETERMAAEQAEADRVEAEQLEADRVESERAEAERLDAEQAEAERLDAEQAETERLDAEQAETERLDAEQAETERLDAEQAETERLDAEQAETERLDAEQAETERLDAEQAETERLDAEQAETERLDAEQAETERLEAEQAETERLDAEQAAAAAEAEAEAVEAERLEAERIETERLAEEQAAADEAEHLETERIETERIETERIAADAAAAAEAEATQAAAPATEDDTDRDDEPDDVVDSADGSQAKSGRKARRAAEKQAAQDAEQAEVAAAAASALLIELAASSDSVVPDEETENEEISASVEDEPVALHDEAAAAAATALLLELASSNDPEPVAEEPTDEPEPEPLDALESEPEPEAPSGPWDDASMADTAALLRELSSLGEDAAPQQATPTTPQRPRPPAAVDKKAKKKIGLFGL